MNVTPAQTYPYHTEQPPQTHPHPHPNYPPPQHGPVPVPPEQGGCDHNRRNRPQSKALLSVAFIFMSGGMNMAWSIGFNSILLTQHMQCSWFIGAIIGAVIGAGLTNRLHRKPIFMFSGVVVVIGGILFASLSTDYRGLLAARYLDGIANGLVVVPMLTLSGEISVIGTRGEHTAGSSTAPFATGVFLQIFYNTLWLRYDTSVNGFDVNQMHGIISVCLGVLALVLAFYFTIESPVFYLVRNDERVALDTQCRLQHPPVLTHETYSLMDEHRRYIAENDQLSTSKSFIIGGRVMVGMLVYRSLNALTLSMAVRLAFTLASLRATSNILTLWTHIVFAGLRMFGAMISSYVMDKAGRKKPMLFAALICGGMAIGLGAIFNNIYNAFFYDKMAAAMYLLFIYELFGGVFEAPSSAYLSECFPMNVKSYFIGFVYVIEMLIHIIIICSNDILEIGTYFYVAGALLFVFFVYGLICLPETKCDSLLQAEHKFRKLLNLRLS